MQEGVPAAIATLLAASIRVWVITGDKQETAINIAISCKLIRRQEALQICNADSPEAALGKLQEVDEKLRKVYAGAGKRRHQASAPGACSGLCRLGTASRLPLESVLGHSVRACQLTAAGSGCACHSLCTQGGAP